MVCRWAQELLGYQFMVVHRHNHMMVDVDALTRRYGPLITMDCMVSTILHHRDIQHKPLAYEYSVFFESKTAKLTPSKCTPSPTPILCNSFITQTCFDYSKDIVNTATPTDVPIVSSSLVLHTTFSRLIHNDVLLFNYVHNTCIAASSASRFSD